MKRKLFLLLCALLTSVGMWADVDYTSKMSSAQNDWTGATGMYGGAGPERYNGNTTAFNAGDVLYQTITDLPNGNYEISFYAWENFSNWEASADVPFGNDIAQVFANSATKGFEVIKNTGGRGWDAANTYTLLTKVTDGTLKYGVKNIARGGNWAVCRPISLKLLDFEDASLNDNTKYLFKNIESGKYLGPGNAWGTQASLIPNAHYNTLHLNNGQYTIESHVSNGGTNYYFSGSYMDSDAAAQLSILKNSDNKYIICRLADNAVYGYDGSSTILSATVAPTSNNALWEIVSYDDAKTALLSATKTVPTDATFLIDDANLGRNNRDFTSWNVTSGGGAAGKGGDNDNQNWQQWNATFDIYQTVSGLPGGKYMLKAQGFYRPGGNDTKSTTRSASLYAGDTNSTPLALVSSTHKTATDADHGFTTANTNENTTYYVPNSQSDVSKAFNAGYYDNTLEDIVVTGGTLKIGAKNEATTGNQWCIIDNFRLFYLGSCLINDAIALPANGDMVAGTWYKFTPDAGRYNLTVTNLANIVYTTDGSILTEDGGTVIATFGANPITFSATTYYIKSSSANNFAYEADSYDVTALVTAYNTAVTEAGTAKTNAEAADKVNAAEKTALDNAITTYGSVEIPGDPEHATRTQKDALETATAALTDATSAVNTSITAYTNAKAYFEAVEPVLATTNFYTSDAYATNYSTPKAAYDAGTLSDVDAAALSYGSRETGNMPAIMLSSWSATGTALYINTWSTEAEGIAPARDFANPFFEYWVAGGDILADNTFTSTIGELTPNALYAVTVKARVGHADRRDNIRENSFTMKVGDEGATVDLSRGKRIGTTVRYIDTYTAYGYTDNDGNLKTIITVAADSKVNWFSFRDMNYAHVEGAEALNTVIAEVTNLSGKVPTNVYNTAYTQVTAHTGVNYPTTDAEFATAISDIRSAVATAATYLDEYTGYLELKNYADALVAVNNNNPTANSTLATAISTAATDANSVANVAALTSVNTTLKDAMKTYAGAANPVGEGNKFNLTFMLADPDVTKYWNGVPGSDNGLWGVQPDGWKNEQDGGNFQVMSNAAVVNGDKAIFMEYWSADAANNGKFTLYLEPTLPAGTYSIDCYAFAGQPTGGSTNAVYFYADDTEGGQISDAQLTKKNISFVNASKKAVKIGMKAKTGNNYRWMGIGYVELYKVPEQVYELNEATAWDHTQSGAGNVEITRTIKVGVNTVVFPFSMNQTEVEDYFGAGSVVYQLSSYEDETIHFITRSGISANEPCLVKATSTTNSAVAYTLNDRTVVAAASASPSVAGTNVTMTGTYAASTSVDQGNYIVSGSNIYLVNSDNVKMKNTRAYITLGTPNLGARLAIIFDEEDPTAINTIEAAESEAGALKDGKYLIEGKIVIVKNGVKYDANGKKLN